MAKEVLSTYELTNCDLVISNHELHYEATICGLVEVYKHDRSNINDLAFVNINMFCISIPRLLCISIPRLLCKYILRSCNNIDASMSFIPRTQSVRIYVFKVD